MTVSDLDSLPSARGGRGVGSDHMEIGGSVEYRWASESNAHGMPHPSELVYFGYRYAERDGARVIDPRYPDSWLMVRDIR